jgi:hypothetical protein
LGWVTLVYAETLDAYVRERTTRRSLEGAPRRLAELAAERRLLYEAIVALDRG